MTGFRTGTSATLAATTKETPFTFNVPAGVQAGDLMLIVVTCFTFTASAPGIATPSGWEQLGTLQDSGASQGLNAYGAVFARTAAGGDAGAAVTFTFTGTPGTDEMWWAAGLGAWEGYAAPSVVSPASGLGGAPACPFATTATGNELPVYLAAAAIGSGSMITGVPAGSTQRELGSAAGICACVADAGVPVPAAGTGVGTGQFTAGDSGWWNVWTVTIAPALTVTLTGSSGGVDSYSVSSIYNNEAGATTLRVLPPVSPSGSYRHSFCYALPVEAGLATDFGDGLTVLQGLDAGDACNMTIVAPSFGSDPWYADNPLAPAVRYESFMVALAGWVSQNLAVTGEEHHHLIGFSKSGIGGQGLLLKHPGIWTRCASWDFPAVMSSYDEFGDDSEAGYGTQANFQQNYQLSQANVDGWAAPFTSAPARIWISGENLYGTDVAAYDGVLATAGIVHVYETPVERAHEWQSGWVPDAAAFLAGQAAPASGSGLLMASGIV